MAVLVHDIQGRNHFVVAAFIIAPDAFIDAIMKIKIFKLFEFRPRRGKQFGAGTDVLIHGTPDVKKE